MAEIEGVLRAAEEEAHSGRYKEAYNLLAHAPWGGGPVDQECRYRRGVYAYQVAHTRLDEFQQSPMPKLTLIKAGCWLARSEAYLTSAGEGVPDPERGRIASVLKRTEQEQERFRKLCRQFAADLFMSRNEVGEREE